MAHFYTDSHIAYETADLLIAGGHSVTRCQARHLKDAPDHEHLWVAAQERAILLTHDTGFRMWHAAWRFWSTAWGAQVEHHGILITPIESIWRPAQAAHEIDAFVSSNVVLRNQCYLSSSTIRWQRV